jgi:hypothetical protein
MAHDELPGGFSREDLLRRAVQERSDRPDAAKDDENGELRSRLAAYLRSRGMSERDIVTACDISLGPQRSAMRGGAFNEGFAGNLHSEVRQQPQEPLTSPASSDRAMTYEEMSGCEPARDSRRFGRDSRMSFDQIFGMLPTLESMQPRRRMSEKALAMDAAARGSFEKMFPEASRIGSSEHDFTAHRR